MKIHDILETEQILEGPNDPHIFKAVFLAGGPGSGKSYVAQKLLTGGGLKPLNSDDVYEYLAKKHNIDLSDPEVVGSNKGQEIRNRAKEITKTREDLYLDGRLGLVIDGTGKDVSKVSVAKKQLGDLGYDTMMLFVNTSEEVAQERNAARARTIPTDMVTVMWQRVQQNIMKFQQVFGAAKFHVIDNSGGLEDPDRKENFDNVYREVQKFLNDPPTKRAAKAWLDKNTKT
jgi:cytidylate kinase